MAWVWTGMVLLSLIFGIATGNLDEVANAALEGAGSAVELSISMAGILCLWSGVMEIMNACGLSAGLARAFRPILRRLLPEASRDEEYCHTMRSGLRSSGRNCVSDLPS